MCSKCKQVGTVSHERHTSYLIKYIGTRNRYWQYLLKDTRFFKGNRNFSLWSSPINNPLSIYISDHCTIISLQNQTFVDENSSLWKRIPSSIFIASTTQGVLSYVTTLLLSVYLCLSSCNMNSDATAYPSFLPEAVGFPVSLEIVFYC